MKKDEILSVQTIAVMGMCFTTLGEYKLYRNLWSCAVRIAQSLGMDKPVNTKLSIKPELCRRLWWTLMICEWYGSPDAD